MRFFFFKFTLAASIWAHKYDDRFFFSNLRLQIRFPVFEKPKIDHNSLNDGHVKTGGGGGPKCLNPSNFGRKPLDGDIHLRKS